MKSLTSVVKWPWTSYNKIIGKFLLKLTIFAALGKISDSLMYFLRMKSPKWWITPTNSLEINFFLLILVWMKLSRKQFLSVFAHEMFQWFMGHQAQARLQQWLNTSFKLLLFRSLKYSHVHLQILLLIISLKGCIKWIPNFGSWE